MEDVEDTRPSDGGERLRRAADETIQALMQEDAKQGAGMFSEQNLDLEAAKPKKDVLRLANLYGHSVRSDFVHESVRKSHHPRAAVLASVIDGDLRNRHQIRASNQPLPAFTLQDLHSAQEKLHAGIMAGGFASIQGMREFEEREISLRGFRAIVKAQLHTALTVEETAAAMHFFHASSTVTEFQQLMAYFYQWATAERARLHHQHTQWGRVMQEKVLHRETRLTGRFRELNHAVPSFEFTADDFRSIFHKLGSATKNYDVAVKGGLKEFASGSMDPTAFRHLLRAHLDVKSVSPTELGALISIFDTTGNHRVPYAEFIREFLNLKRGRRSWLSLDKAEQHMQAWETYLEEREQANSDSDSNSDSDGSDSDGSDEASGTVGRGSNDGGSGHATARGESVVASANVSAQNTARSHVGVRDSGTGSSSSGNDRGSSSNRKRSPPSVPDGAGEGGGSAEDAGAAATFSFDALMGLAHEPDYRVTAADRAGIPRFELQKEPVLGRLELHQQRQAAERRLLFEGGELETGDHVSTVSSMGPHSDALASMRQGGSVARTQGQQRQQQRRPQQQHELDTASIASRPMSDVVQPLASDTRQRFRIRGHGPAGSSMVIRANTPEGGRERRKKMKRRLQANTFQDTPVWDRIEEKHVFESQSDSDDDDAQSRASTKVVHRRSDRILGLQDIGKNGGRGPGSSFVSPLRATGGGGGGRPYDDETASQHSGVSDLTMSSMKSMTSMRSIVGRHGGMGAGSRALLKPAGLSRASGVTQPLALRSAYGDIRTPNLPKCMSAGMAAQRAEKARALRYSLRYKLAGQFLEQLMYQKIGVDALERKLRVESIQSGEFSNLYGAPGLTISRSVFANSVADLIPNIESSFVQSVFRSFDPWCSGHMWIAEFAATLFAAQQLMTHSPPTTEQVLRCVIRWASDKFPQRRVPHAVALRLLQLFVCSEEDEQRIQLLLDGVVREYKRSHLSELISPSQSHDTSDANTAKNTAIETPSKRVVNYRSPAPWRSVVAQKRAEQVRELQQYRTLGGNAIAGISGGPQQNQSILERTSNIAIPESALVDAILANEALLQEFENQHLQVVSHWRNVRKAARKH